MLWEERSGLKTKTREMSGKSAPGVQKTTWKRNFGGFCSRSGAVLRVLEACWGWGRELEKDSCAAVSIH